MQRWRHSWTHSPRRHVPHGGAGHSAQEDLCWTTKLAGSAVVLQLVLGRRHLGPAVGVWRRLASLERFISWRPGHQHGYQPHAWCWSNPHDLYESTGGHSGSRKQRARSIHLQLQFRYRRADNLQVGTRLTGGPDGLQDRDSFRPLAVPLSVQEPSWKDNHV